MKELILGFTKYLYAYRFVKNHKLWSFVLIPGLVNILVVVGIIYASVYFNDDIRLFITDQSIGLKDYLPNFLVTAFVFFVGVMIRLILFALYFYFYKTAIMILLSPMMSYLAEKVREILTGELKPFSLDQMLNDSWRGVRISVRGLFLELICYLILGLLVFIPIVNFLTPVLLILIQSYFHGFSMLDYCMEARGYDYQESIDSIKKRKPLAIGNGIGFYTLTLIPIIGWMLAPTLGIVSAYLSLERRNE